MERFEVKPPFRCTYGYNIEVGENFHANVGCMILDGAKVTIGDNVILSPEVEIITEGHTLGSVRSTIE